MVVEDTSMEIENPARRWRVVGGGVGHADIWLE
jgi:hypothetical protein